MPIAQADSILLSINTIRTLTIDAVQKANSDHLGAAGRTSRGTPTSHAIAPAALTAGTNV
jgi:hypothetical protein